MPGCIEQLTPEKIKGWAPHDPARNGPALVRVLVADNVVAEAVADGQRLDVAKKLNSTGSHGFDIRLTDKIPQADIPKVQVVSSYEDGWNSLTLLPGARTGPRTGRLCPVGTT